MIVGREPMTRTAATLLLLFLAQALPALEPFSASYQLLWNGEKKGETWFTLQSDGRSYSFESFTRPAGVPEQEPHEVLERSQGHFDGTRPEPDSYYYAVKTGRETDMVEVFFDWKQMLMTIRGNDGQERYKLEEGTQDRLSYLLRAMALAAGSRSEAAFPRVSIEGAEKISLEEKSRRYLSTPAGRFLAQEVTIRNENGSSVRHLWLAVKKGFMPVALEHRTTEGLIRMELTGITSR